MRSRPDGIVIAIDGPSGAGKSTIARLLAERLGYVQIDTGAMYRAAAFLLDAAGVNLGDLAAVENFCGNLDIRLESVSGRQLVRANGKDVTAQIRTPEMSLLTSRVSALKPVREALLKSQQQMGRRGGVVLEGRDIGTVVFPDAEMKFYLNASVEERGRRRFEELMSKGEQVTIEETIAGVVERDRQDSERDLAPLRQADDAIPIDSSRLSIDEVLTKMAAMCRKKIDDLESITMKVILAKQAGFCFGVKRATNLAFEAAGKDHQKTYTLGPIIHSPQVVGRLAELGVRALDSLDGLETGTIIIRSHGVALEEITEAKQKDLTIVDATCPFVKKAQEHVKSLSETGYGVVVVGDAVHPEVQGIVSYGGDKVFVVASGEDVKKLPKMSKIGVVAQTTQSFENLKNVVGECLLRGGEVRVYNTICDATAVRQDEAKDLASRVDCMLVVGGFNSANTHRLFEVCIEIQPRTYQIETAADINPAWFEGVERVGVTAGASTPKWIIEEVMNKIEELNKSD